MHRAQATTEPARSIGVRGPVRARDVCPAETILLERQRLWGEGVESRGKSWTRFITRRGGGVMARVGIAGVSAKLVRRGRSVKVTKLL